MPRLPPSVGEQLAKLLHQTGISQRELGRRLALPNGDARFERRWKGKTRWVAKLLRGGVERPTAESIAAIEAAVGMPGYFKIPPRPQPGAAAGWRETIERRLIEVAEQAARDAISLREDLAEALQRIEALERRAGGEGLSASETTP